MKNSIYLKQLYTSLSNQITIRKSKIFTTFENIHCSFNNNLKSKGIKNQIKAHFSYLANSYFYNYNVLDVYYVNIASSKTLEKIKILL